MGSGNAADALRIPDGADDRIILREGQRKRGCRQVQGLDVRPVHRSAVYRADIHHYRIDMVIRRIDGYGGHIQLAGDPLAAKHHLLRRFHAQVHIQGG